MLRKIIGIKNVGRFRNSAAPGNPQLAKHTFIAGANGYGKTTLCAVLRSLQTGDPTHILGRKTLGTADAPTIELLLDGGQARFDGAAWSATKPEIAIFDGVFVAENVHSGEVVDIEHKRNLYRVIVGDAGVRLAAQDADLAAESRAKTGEISTASKAVQPHVPAGMKLDAFIALPEAADIAVQIEAQARSVDALRQAGALRARPALSEFAIPGLPADFTGLMARTIDDIAQDAEQRLSSHLAAHGMTASGGNWIADGLSHADDTCPFCGQDTLSAGDRTTLALAFFLAHLERDPGAAGKLVVFDDPFNSQDSFRRRQTVHEIMKVAGKCAQIIVLSHDATFLKQVWDKSPAADRVALSIADHRAQGSKIMPVDLEHACRGRTATDIDDLQTYLTTGAGGLLDVVRKMRVVLETHCRTTYPGSFLAGDWLGDMVRKIREGGDAHPAQALYDELDQINGYTSQYHHGENMADATPDQIDPSELTGFTRRTLRIVNALQA